LGQPGQPEHAAVQEAMRRIEHAAKSTNTALGILVTSPQAAREWIDRGARYIVVSLEGLLRSATRSFFEAVRS
jgi:2-keto-3-deoxy-L-rhamnonate aldolase RhmA